MKLKRVGVFETNSSSCHSMAIVGRLQKKQWIIVQQCIGVFLEINA